MNSTSTFTSSSIPLPPTNPSVHLSSRLSIWPSLSPPPPYSSAALDQIREALPQIREALPRIEAGVAELRQGGEAAMGVLRGLQDGQAAANKMLADVETRLVHVQHLTEASRQQLAETRQARRWAKSDPCGP